MTATNHALTGATIALALHGSWLALPLAFVSHFVLDAIPHFGTGDGESFIGTNVFRNVLLVDAVCASLIALGILLAHPAHVWIVDFSAFAAASPDLMWVPRFIRARRGQPSKPQRDWNWLMRLHSKIQWCERPWGAVTEILWFFAFSSLLVRLV